MDGSGPTWRVPHLTADSRVGSGAPGRWGPQVGCRLPKLLLARTEGELTLPGAPVGCEGKAGNCRSGLLDLPGTRRGAVTGYFPLRFFRKGRPGKLRSLAREPRDIQEVFRTSWGWMLWGSGTVLPARGLHGLTGEQAASTCGGEDRPPEFLRERDPAGIGQ